MKKLTLVLLTALLLLAACGKKDDTSSENGDSSKSGSSTEITIGTATSGSTGYMYGVALSTIVNNHLDNVKLTPIPTAGVIENDRLLRDGETDMIIHTGEYAHLSYTGKGQFEEPYELLSLFPIYASFLNVVVSDDSKIQSFKDLKGKRIGMGPPGSSANVLMTKLLKINGLNEGDYKAMPLSLEEQIDAFKDGTIDAISIIASYDTPAFVDLATSRKVRWLSIEDEAYKKLEEESPIGSYMPMVLPGGSYKNQNDDVKTVGVPLWIVTDKKLDDDLVKNIMNVFFDNLDEAQKVHAVVSETNKELIENAVSPVPWHPEAAKVLKEKGYNIKFKE